MDSAGNHQTQKRPDPLEIRPQRLAVYAEMRSRMGCEVDHGISGAKGRDERPQFDRLWREFDAIMAWRDDPEAGPSGADDDGQASRLFRNTYPLDNLGRYADTTLYPPLDPGSAGNHSARPVAVRSNEGRPVGD
jgi:hypothetical protein